MDRENCTENFYGLFTLELLPLACFAFRQLSWFVTGFGYHRLKDRFTPGPPTEPRKGVAALCPAVFRLPSPTEGHKSVGRSLYY